MTQDLNLYTMQTLFEQPLEPIDFLVDGLFAQGLYILGGSPKVGKSWLALQLCLAVCTGTPFLGAGGRPPTAAFPCAASDPDCSCRTIPLRTGSSHRTRAGAAVGTRAGGTPRYPTDHSGHTAKGAYRVAKWDVLCSRLQGCVST